MAPRSSITTTSGSGKTPALAGAAGKALSRTSGAAARRAELTLRGGRVRVVLAVMLFASATWLVGLAGYFASVALGLNPVQQSSQTVAAVLVTPAVLACAVPLLDGALALAGRRDGAGRWTRIFVEAAAALIFAAFATLLTAVFWPGVAALALAAALGFVGGFLRWQPAELPAPTGVPLVLLLDERPGAGRAPRPVSRDMWFDDEAA